MITDDIIMKLALGLENDIIDQRRYCTHKLKTLSRQLSGVTEIEAGLESSR